MNNSLHLGPIVVPILFVTLFASVMEQPFVFVHITDIHLQRRSAESSYSYFRHFVKDILPVIQPSLVVNTGDITQSQQLDLKGMCVLVIFDE